MLGGVEFHGGSIPDTFRAIPDRLDALKVENPPENPKSANFSWELVPSTWATTVNTCTTIKNKYRDASPVSLSVFISGIYRFALLLLSRSSVVVLH